MSTIYLDVGALRLPCGGGDKGAFAIDAESGKLVGHLLEFGHEVVILGAPDRLEHVEASMAGSARVAMMVAGADGSGMPGDAAGWLVTDDADGCAAARDQVGLRTVLVGAGAADAAAAQRPADRLARSLGDAVLGILAAEAMA